MKRLIGLSLVLLTLLVVCRASHATTITLNSLSNSSNTGTVTFVDLNGQTTTQSVHISQFQMTQVDGANSKAIYTYCVDLQHSEQFGVAYTVVPKYLTDAFGVTNGNEIGYLYRTYGDKNLAGSTSAVNDAALQLALWDLSISTHHPTTFTDNGSPGTYSSGDSLFKVSNISSDVATKTGWYLNDALGKTAGDVWLLQSIPESDPSHQQSVLAHAPEPATYISSTISAGLLIVFGLVRRFRNVTSPV